MTLQFLARAKGNVKKPTFVLKGIATVRPALLNHNPKAFNDALSLFLRYRFPQVVFKYFSRCKASARSKHPS
jgi:hypothetical protein